jgi:hypothetical protein
MEGSARGREESKRFFLKKEAKTFASCWVHRQGIKVFWFFFSKKNGLFSY